MTQALFAIVLLLSVLFQISFQKSEELPHAVIEFMGSRPMRYHHFLWHNLRENWFGLNASTQHAITALGWAPPRPTLIFLANGTEVLLQGNGAGEDFFYMHRQMVIQTNKIVAGTPYEKIVGWKRAPYPGDPKWPVPPKFNATYSTKDDFLDGFINSRKTDEYFWNNMQAVDEMLFDPAYLKTITLAQLGNACEYGIHRDLHLRYAELGPMGEIRPTDKNPTSNISTKWDNLTYQFLGDSYSSHVSPTFWKIHGWVDDHIEAWRVANGLDAVDWSYTWENGPSATVELLYAAGDVNDSDDDADPDADGASDGEFVHPHMETMEQAMKILLKTGISGRFDKDIKHPIVEEARNHRF